MPLSPLFNHLHQVGKFETISSRLLKKGGDAYEAKNKPIHLGSLHNAGNHLGYWGERHCRRPASLSPLKRSKNKEVMISAMYTCLHANRSRKRMRFVQLAFRKGMELESVLKAASNNPLQRSARSAVLMVSLNAVRAPAERER